MDFIAVKHCEKDGDVVDGRAERIQTQAQLHDNSETSDTKMQLQVSEEDEERVHNIAKDLGDVKDMMFSLHSMVLVS